MSNTSQKHRNFVSEPMGDKPVTDVAGIGEITGKRLCNQGCDKAYVLLGQFLLLKKDDKAFMQWMMETVKANKKQCSDCHQCLSEWCGQFL